MHWGHYSRPRPSPTWGWGPDTLFPLPVKLGPVFPTPPESSVPKKYRAPLSVYPNKNTRYYISVTSYMVSAYLRLRFHIRLPANRMAAAAPQRAASNAAVEDTAEASCPVWGDTGAFAPFWVLPGVPWAFPPPLFPPLFPLFPLFPPLFPPVLFFSPNRNVLKWVTVNVTVPSPLFLKLTSSPCPSAP